MTELWCYIKAERNVFLISILPHLAVDDLKNQIDKAGSSRSFVEYDLKGIKGAIS